MKRYIFLFLAVLSFLTGQAQGGYDPVNPGDPNPYRKLTLQASPKAGGSVNSYSGSQIAVGQEVTCYASAKTYYEFVHWTKNGEVVSTDCDYTFTMPDENVELIAVFEYNYDPVSPDDPQEVKPSHRVTLTAVPGKGGRFSSSVFKMYEEQTTSVYAYPEAGYIFDCWMAENTVVSQSNPMTIKMGKADLKYQAVFRYNPASPQDPSANSFDVSSGKLIIDRFETGRLNDAIYSAVGGTENYSLVKSVIVIGQMGSSDFGFMYRLGNCELLDLSRTTGYTNIPSYSFEENSKLKTVYLPTGIESIANNAFSGCSSLESIYMYALTPPVATDYAFNDLPSTSTVYVPSSSVELYVKSAGWNGLNVQSLNAEEKNLTVEFAGSAQMKEYNGMSIELTNIQSRQTYKYLVTNSRKYTFFALMKNSSYNVCLKTQHGIVISEVKDVTIADENVTVKLKDFLTQKDICLQVKTPEGDDVTKDVNVLWQADNGEYLGQGSTLKKVLEGTVVQYTVSLSGDFAKQYRHPKPILFEVTKNTSGTICYTLEQIPMINVQGRIVDVETRQVIPNATLFFSQKVNGNNIKTFSAKTDRKGLFSVDVFALPAEVSLSAYNYLNSTIDTLDFSKYENSCQLEDLQMKAAIGATFTFDIKYTYCQTEKQTKAAQAIATDFSSMDLEFYNVTKQKKCKLTSYRFPQVILMDDASIGDVFRITASNRNSSFYPDEIEVCVDSLKRALATVNFVEKGYVEATVLTNKTNAAIGALYDSSTGQLYDFKRIIGKGFSLENIPDGNYDLIVYEHNDLLPQLSNKGRFDDIGLKDNLDYLVRNITVQRGNVTRQELDAVPLLDVNKIFMYEACNNSSFVISKPSELVGKYATLTAKLARLSIEDIDEQEFIVDLPKDVVYIDGSAIIGRQLVDAYVENNSLHVPLPKDCAKEAVKFCVVPTVAGNFMLTGYIFCEAQDKEYLLPIKNVTLEGKNIAISVPPTIAKPDFTVSGSANPSETVKVYDGDDIIGEAISKADGTWQAECTLQNAYNLTTHHIYAKVQTKDGISYSTGVSDCFYNKDEIVPRTVTMSYYNGWMGRQINMIFDFETGTVSGDDYSFYTETDFTFVADFTNNDTTLVSDVKLKVLTSDNSIVTLPAVYDDKQDKWVASRKFGSNNLPVNLKVEYFSNITTEIDKDFQDLIAKETQAAIDELVEDDKRAQELFDKLDKLIDENNEEEFLKNLQLINGLFTRIVVCDGIEPEINEKDLIDRLNNANDDAEREQIFDEERRKHQTEPSKEYTDLVEELTTPIELSVPSSGNLPAVSISAPAIFSDDFSSVHLPNSKYTITSSETQTRYVELESQSGEKIRVDYSNILPELDDTGSNIEQWINAAQLFNENIDRASATIDIFSHELYGIYPIAEKIIGAEEARLSKQVGIDLYLLRVRGEQNRYNTAANIRGYRHDVNRFRKDWDACQEMGKIKKGINTASSSLGRVSGALGVVGDVVGGVIDIAETVNVNSDWNSLIEKINRQCQKPNPAEDIEEKAKKHRGWILRRNIAKTVADGVCTTADVVGLVAAPESAGLSLLLNVGSFVVGCGTSHWQNEYRKTDEQHKREILADIKNRCKKEEDEEKDDNFPFKKRTPIYDPSGYVYEGVSSNRVEGATATVFYKDETADEYGVVQGNAVKWDATEYNQQNPLFTDKNGHYAWDVPQGLWQVMIEKDGYETTFSEWLPVPPPQLDVNLALKQISQPMVKVARAYRSAVELEFDKYMMPEYLTTSNIVVMDGDKIAEGVIELLDDEVCCEGEDSHYASRIRFNTNAPFKSSFVRLSVSNRVQSYAGIRMQDDFTQEFEIEQEITAIDCDSVFNVEYGKTGTLKLRVNPVTAASGKTLLLSVASSSILALETDNIVVGPDGNASITMTGLLPGSTAIHVSIDGYNLQATIVVNVIQAKGDELVETPTASIPSGEVEKGTEIYLSCETEGATIYYTTDGSCPCDLKTAKVYDGSPIVINESMTIKVMAAKEGLGESDVVEFTYTVNNGMAVESITIDDDLKIYPIPVRDKLNISVGGKTINSVTVVALNGITAISTAKPAKEVQLDVRALTLGIYVVNVATAEKTYRRKVLKIE